MKTRTIYAMLLLLLCYVATPAYAQMAETGTAQEDVPRLLPEDLEIGLALSATPGHLREDATVYVLQRGGFVVAREGTNGYTCFVQRTLWYLDQQTDNALIPICYDPVGTQTYLPVDLDDARYREQGLSNRAVKERIQEGFDEGKYQAPPRTGISFMLSPIQEIPNGDGAIFRFIPHYMFYAPHVTDEELGLKMEGWLSFMLPVIRREGPHGMFIVPVGEKERRLIEEDAKELIARVKEWIRRGSS